MSRYWLAIGVVIVMLLTVCAMGAQPAMAGGDPIPEEQAKIDAARNAGRLPPPDNIQKGHFYEDWVRSLSPDGSPLYAGTVEAVLNNPQLSGQFGDPWSPSAVPLQGAGLTGGAPIADGPPKPGSSAGTKPAAPPAPEMVSVATDERKALIWYVWFLGEKLKKMEAAKATDAGLTTPDKKGRTRIDKVKDKLDKAKGVLDHWDKEGIRDGDLKADIAKEQANEAKAQAAAGTTGGK